MRRELSILGLVAAFVFFLPVVSLASSVTFLTDNDCTELLQPNAVIYVYPSDCKKSCKQALSLYEAVAREPKYQQKWKFFAKPAMPASPILLAQYTSGEAWSVCFDLIKTVPIIWVNKPKEEQKVFTDTQQLASFLQA